MFKFLHAADIHLDSPMNKLDHYEGAPVEELRHATRRAFENLVGLAREEQVDFVILAGDLYDGDWKDYNTGLYFISQVNKLREAAIAVYIVAGNHDAASRITKTLRLPDGVFLFPAEEPSSLQDRKLDLAIHAQSFATQAVKKDLSARYPRAVPGLFNIGILHTCATGREGHEPYAPCTMDGLISKGYDYWALGHVHQREQLVEDPPILFSGNIQGRHIGEAGPKGCMLVDVDTRGRPKVTFRPLDVLRWMKVAVESSDASDAYDVVENVVGHLGELMEANDYLPLVARVEISGSSHAHETLASDPERWKNEIRAAAMDLGRTRVWIEKVRLHDKTETFGKTRASAGGPLDELLAHLEEVRSDETSLLEIGRALKDLVRKLPREIRDGPEAISPEDPLWLKDILAQVRSMLLHRLVRKGELS